MSSRQRTHKSTTRARRQARGPREEYAKPQELDAQTGLPSHLVEAVRASAGGAPAPAGRKPAFHHSRLGAGSSRHHARQHAAGRA